MLDQLIITGVSGAIIIFMMLGFGKIIKISKLAKTEQGWKKATSTVLGKSFVAWLSVFCFLTIAIIIVFGLIVSIIFS